MKRFFSTLVTHVPPVKPFDFG